MAVVYGVYGAYILPISIHGLLCSEM